MFAQRQELTKWSAPGSEDTEFGVLMEPEVPHGEAEITREFKLEAVRLIKDRGESYVQASHLGVHTSRRCARTINRTIRSGTHS